MGDNELDVAACLERVRLRDDDAAQDLVEYLYPLVIKIVRAHLPRRLDEEDLAQDIFLKLFANLNQYRGAVPLKHWVSRVAVTTCLDKLRMQQRRPEWRWADLSEKEAEVLDAVLQGPDESVESDAFAAHELASRLLAMLKPDDRLVVTLLDLEGRTLAEIEEITGWNRTVIKVRAFRARRKMKKFLEQLEKEKPNQ